MFVCDMHGCWMALRVCVRFRTHGGQGAWVRGGDAPTLPCVRVGPNLGGEIGEPIVLLGGS